MSRFNNIVFFSPCKFTGGTEYYFIRLADYIARNHKEYNVYYTEYHDGFARKIVNNPHITFLDFHDGEKTEIPDNSVICISLHNSMKMNEMACYNRNNSTFMMWFMHFRHMSFYFTMDNYYKVGRKCRREVGTHLEWLSDHRILNFLGNGAYFKLSRQFLFPYHAVEAIPIPIETDRYGSDCKVTRELLGNPIRFCWLGRLDREKSRNILTYMNELEQVHKDHKIILSIIGLGPMEKQLKLQSSKYSYPIDFVGEKRGDSLDEYIRENVDVGLASGTSSMEFALRKVPVIQDWLLDKAYSAGVRTCYHFINDPLIIEDTGIKRHDHNTFSYKLDEIIHDYKKCCQEVYDYVMTKRSIGVCAKSFFTALSELETVEIQESFYHIDEINRLALNAHNNWMEKLHLRRIYVPICKILNIRPATI